MKAAILVAHGTPDSLDQMPEYLAAVRGGRPASPELVAEMRHNYAAIGGRSPLTDLTRAQAAALSAVLGLPVYAGMRNWHPFVKDVLAQAAADGVTEMVAVPMAPQYGRLSVGKYRDALEAARPAGMELRVAGAWHAHPGLLEAFAAELRRAMPAERVVFTAHSLPVRVIEAGDPYAGQVHETASGVAGRAGITGWLQAWQSAGRTPEPWLGPSLEETVDRLAAEGVRDVLVCPVGFVCDHTEILYDVDVQAAGHASRLGVTLRRTASLNDSPGLIGALAEVVRAA
jgi:ferrochelatase